MAGWEVAGGIAAALITGVAALQSGRDSVRWLWRSFGWHGHFWKWLVRAVEAVDVIIAIPERLTKNERLLDAHIKQSKPQVALLNRIAEKVDLLPGVAAMTAEVVGQVKSNGGSSLLDSNHRIEEALGLPAPPKNRPLSGPTSTESA